MISATNFFVLIGEITIAVIAARAIGWLWKSRNWKPTPWLGLGGRLPW